MTEYVIFNAEHYVTVEGVRFYEQGDALEGDERLDAIEELYIRDVSDEISG